MCRLTELQKENDSKGLEMLTESGRFAALADRANNGLKPRAISSFNLFQTPEIIAEKMVQTVLDNFVRQHPGPLTILEPSAGLGRIYQATKKHFPKGLYTLVEINKDCTKELYNNSGPGTTVIENDFLKVDKLPFETYDIIIMNPPFKMGTDVKHILHAKKFLAKGGVLVSLCYNGVKQNKVLKPICDTWEELPSNSFKSEGTHASISMLTIINN